MTQKQVLYAPEMRSVRDAPRPNERFRVARQLPELAAYEKIRGSFSIEKYRAPMVARILSNPIVIISPAILVVIAIVYHYFS